MDDNFCLDERHGNCEPYEIVSCGIKEEINTEYVMEVEGGCWGQQQCEAAPPVKQEVQDDSLPEAPRQGDCPPGKPDRSLENTAASDTGAKTSKGENSAATPQASLEPNSLGASSTFRSRELHTISQRSQSLPASNCENVSTVRKAVRCPRPNGRQMAYLLDFMSVHPDFAASRFVGVTGRHASRKMWHHLATTLNTLGHAKSEPDWVKTWTDLKSKARRKASNLQLAHGTAGAGAGNPAVADSLTETDRKIVSLLGLVTSAGPASANHLPEGEEPLSLSKDGEAAESDGDSRSVTYVVCPDRSLQTTEPATVPPQQQQPPPPPHVPPAQPPPACGSQAPTPGAAKKLRLPADARKLLFKKEIAGQFVELCKQQTSAFQSVAEVAAACGPANAAAANAAAAERMASAAEQQLVAQRNMASDMQELCRAVQQQAAALEKQAVAMEAQAAAVRHQASASESLAAAISYSNSIMQALLQTLVDKDK